MGFFSTVIKAYTSQWKNYGGYQEATDCRGTGTVLRKYHHNRLFKLYPCPETRAVIEEFILPQLSNDQYFIHIGFAVNGREISTTPSQWDPNDKSFIFLDFSTPEYTLRYHHILELGINGIFLGMFNDKNLSY